MCSSRHSIIWICQIFKVRCSRNTETARGVSDSLAFHFWTWPSSRKLWTIVSFPETNAKTELSRAIVLLLKSAQLDDSSSDLTAPAKAIVVTMLYCLPLAIDQVGAAISSNMCSIHDYPQLYAIHRRELLMFPSFEGVSNSDRAVYITWDISYMAIHADASGTSDLP